MTRYLVVADQTAESDELRQRLTELATEDRGAEFVLLVPATHVSELLVWEEGRSDEAAHRRAEAARRVLVDAGLPVVEVKVGDPKPQTAIADELYSGATYAGIVISTFPSGLSRWLHMDLPTRVRRMAPDSPVIHVVSTVHLTVHSRPRHSATYLATRP